MRFTKSFLSAVFCLIYITSLKAEEVKIKKGIVLIQPFVESRTRAASEKTMFGDIVKKNQSIFYTNRLLLRVATEFFERFEIYGDIGIGNISAPDFDDFSSGLSLAYGGGINLKVSKSSGRRDPYAIAGLRYIQYEPLKDTVNVYLDNILTAVNEEIIWREWEMGVGAGFRSGSLELNAGVRFSLIDARDRLYTQDFEEKMKLNEEDNAGIFINADIYIDQEEQFAFNIGITTIDVNSVSAGIKLWF